MTVDASPTPSSISPAPRGTTGPTADPSEDPPRGAAQQFSTDFTKHSVPYSEILSGGPPKDGIPALKDPAFVSVAEADAWLKPVEPVILVENNGEAKAYPIQILIWHEIANDSIGGEPMVVTFCPLCNTAIAFHRTFHGRVLDFGTTGRLRYSNLIMYDRHTETWWQQATGEAIAGDATGSRLQFHPATIISWEEFRTAYPLGSVLSRETGYPRDYGRNPYLGYDNVNRSPFLYVGPSTPDLLPPMERVLTVELDDEAVAYPYTRIQEAGVVNDSIGGKPVVIIWQSGTASPLDASRVVGREVGSAAAYSASLDGQLLTFQLKDEYPMDDQTGSTWNLLGHAVAGELRGAHLEPLVSINHFWFSWAAFRPDTRIYQP